MAAVESQMLALGTRAPAFSLPDLDGAPVSPGDFPGRPLLVMFLCNHCPFVKHVADELARLGRDYAEQGVAIFAINSNDVENYPGFPDGVDGKDMMGMFRKQAERFDTRIVTEDIATKARETIHEIRRMGRSTVVVEIPGPEGKDPHRPALIDLIQEALGIHL